LKILCREVCFHMRFYFRSLYADVVDSSSP
jgi:hypothetical protein